jgi:collagenase-like protein with putative collagen-binding domain
VAYLPEGGRVSLDLRGAPRLSVRWFDPRQGVFRPAETVEGGGVRSFSAPGPGDWALLMQRAGAAPAGTSFHTLPPCRSVDTREGQGTAAQPLLPGQERRIGMTGRCGVPAGARAVAANLTVLGPTAVGHLEVWPADQPQPGVSFLNFQPGRERASSQIFSLGGDGAVTAEATGGGAAGVGLLIDVNGYFD